MSTTSHSSDRTPSTVILITGYVLAFALLLLLVVPFGYREFRRAWSTIRYRVPLMMWNGEIYVAEQCVPLGRGPTGESGIIAMNPKTGGVRDTGWRLPEEANGSLVSADRIWISSESRIIEFDGKTVIQHQPTVGPDLTTCLERQDNLFEWDRKPATIFTDDLGKHRIYSLVDGQWVAGPEIALPGSGSRGAFSGRRWAFDEEHGQERMIPRTTKDATTPSCPWSGYEVRRIGDDYHLTYLSVSSEWQLGYRKGFDFIVDDSEVVSALAPANAIADSTGWIKTSAKRCWESHLRSLHGRPVILETTFEGLQVISPMESKPKNPEEIETLKLPGPGSVSYLQSRSTFLEDAQTGECFLASLSKLSTLRVYQLHGNKFEPTTIRLTGFAEPILQCEVKIVVSVLLAILLANILFLWGCDFILQRRRMNDYSFGHQTVALASLRSRCLARSIDLAVLLTPLIGFIVFNFHRLDAEEFVMWHINILQEIYQSRGNWIAAASQNHPFKPLFDDSTIFSFGFAVAWTVSFFVLTVFLQGLFGVSLGKWICGIRVVRATLRRCGVLRALLRDTLLCIDTLNLLTPILAVVSMMNSNGRQRLGDRTADTIVVYQSNFIANASLRKDQIGLKRHRE